MAIVVTVAQQKGGAGKSTVAANLAVAWALSGKRVAVLDIDPQHSLARWHALRTKQEAAAPVALSDVAGWRLAGEVGRLVHSYEVVVIDSPPQVDTDAMRAVRAADLVLIPVQPSPPDLWAAEGTLTIAAREHRPVRLLLNRAPASGKLRAGIEADIAAAGHPVMAAALGNRIGFAAAFAQGLGVLEMAPRSVAGREMQAMFDELLGILA